MERACAMQLAFQQSGAAFCPIQNGRARQRHAGSPPPSRGQALGSPARLPEQPLEPIGWAVHKAASRAWDGNRRQARVRTRLSAGGSRIRTLGPPGEGLRFSGPPVRSRRFADRRHPIACASSSTRTSAVVICSIYPHLPVDTGAGGAPSRAMSDPETSAAIHHRRPRSLRYQLEDSPVQRSIQPCGDEARRKG